jgi:hypothetical protein
MSTPTSFRCTHCGESHELAFAYHSDAPDYWQPEYEQEGRGVLGDENCEIEDNFFVRGRICIPVVDTDEHFEWGVWVSLAEPNYRRMLELWDTPGRETEPPYFAWLSSEVTVYEPSTLNLKAMVHTRPVGERPVIELEPTDHPLAVEQREGITLDRVGELAVKLHHPG